MGRFAAAAARHRTGGGFRPSCRRTPFQAANEPMKNKSAFLAGVVAFNLASLTSDDSQARSRAGLFGSVDGALAFARKLGPSWQTAQEIPSRVKPTEFPERVFQFGPEQFLHLTTDRSGVVRSFLLVDFTPLDIIDRYNARRCSKLPDYMELSQSMLRVTEPSYTKEDLALVQGVAKRGWTPVIGELGAKVNNTAFWFSSRGKKCSAEMRDGDYLAGRPWG